MSPLCCSPQIPPKPPKEAATGWSGLIWTPLPNRRGSGKNKKHHSGAHLSCFWGAGRVQDAPGELHPEMHHCPQEMPPARAEPPSRPARRDAAYPKDVG